MPNQVISDVHAISADNHNYQHLGLIMKFARFLYLLITAHVVICFPTKIAPPPCTQGFLPCGLYCLQCFRRYLSAKLQKLFEFEDTMKKKSGKDWKKTEKRLAILFVSCGDAVHLAGIGNEIWLFCFLETNYPNCSLICFNYSFFVGGGRD